MLVLDWIVAESEGGPIKSTRKVMLDWLNENNMLILDWIDGDFFKGSGIHVCSGKSAMLRIIVFA